MAAAASMTAEPRLTAVAPATSWLRSSLKVFWLSLGFVLILLGAVGALLPGHLGVPVVVVGLVMVLRNSRQARKTFIRWQRKHPKVVFPLRRLMRKNPEILPVVWQGMLRTEHFVLRRFKFMGRTRRAIFRRLRRR
jgi:hypothetical protein